MTPRAGYSGTPLGRKLGLSPGMKVRLLLGAHKGVDEYWSTFEADAGSTPDPGSFELLEADDAAPADFTHLFVDTLEDLREGLAASRGRMAVNGMVWVSWPKKASPLPSEIGRAEVMAEGHAVGLVDVKVCAVDQDWSGLKFVIPVADRG